MSPTQRSLKLMRDRGYLVAITEKYNPFAKIRQDLFGFIDLLAIKGDETLAIQTTSGANVSARINKIAQSQAARIWLEGRNRTIIVQGWSKRGKRGKRKIWDCREVYLSEFDLNEPPSAASASSTQSPAVPVSNL